MKRYWIRSIAVASCLMLGLVTPTNGVAVSPKQDVDVVLIEHFENTNSAGYVSGSVAYVDGPFGKAADFTSGSWLRYTLPSWQTGPWNNPAGKQGTIDLWVYPLQVGKIFLDINWFSTQSMPPSGHVLSFVLGDDARLHVGTWPAYGFTSASTIPLNQWTHIWFTWGAEGTRLYLNGELDSSFTENKYPALNPTSYLYVPAWTQSSIGYIDELRIRSSFQRVPCKLYPLAVSSTVLAASTPGQSIPNIFGAVGSGNFGWLSWTGSTQSTNLIASLTPPGNSDAYVDPDDPTDYEVSLDDWIVGLPGIGNSAGVRASLDTLIDKTITVPVWDFTENRGDALRYHVSGFARMRITSYDLPAKRITATYVGPATCS